MLDGPTQRTTGLLQSVNCRAGVLVVRGVDGSANFSATPATAIYVGTEKLTKVCALEHFVGSQAVVWWKVSDGRRIAGRITVLVFPVRAEIVTAPDHEGHDSAQARVRPPVLAPIDATNPPSPNASQAKDMHGSPLSGVTIDGVVKSRASNALLVATKAGPRPVVVTSDTAIFGMRRTLHEIAPLDLVLATGTATTNGTLVADRIDIVGKLSKQVTGYVTAVRPGVLVLNEALVIPVTGSTVIIVGNRLVLAANVTVGQGVTVAVAGGSWSGNAGDAANINAPANNWASNAGAAGNVNTSGSAGASGNASGSASAGSSGSAGASGNASGSASAGSSGSANASGNASGSASAGSSGSANASGNASASGSSGSTSGGASAGAGVSGSVGVGNGGVSGNVGVSGDVGVSGGGASGNAGVSAGGNVKK